MSNGGWDEKPRSKTLQELQDSIGAWHRIKFPDASLAEIAAKVEEEAKELVAAEENADFTDAEEVADVMIACLAYCARSGIVIETAIAEKMAVNEKREWKRDNSGAWRRVKGEK